MGQRSKEWQDADYILGFYDRKHTTARKRYREYVEKGINDGRCAELIGGGHVRSAGGWSVVKAIRKRGDRTKGDERILGNGGFVERVLREAQEDFERKSKLQAGGYDFEWLVDRVTRQLEMEREEILASGKYPQNVRTRSLLCYWGTRELGMTTVELSHKLNLSQPAISQAVAKGKKIAKENEYCLMGE